MNLPIETDTWLSVKAMLGIGWARRAKSCIVSNELVPSEVLDWLGSFTGPEDDRHSEVVLTVMQDRGLIRGNL